MSDWFLDNFGWCLLGLGVLALVGIAWAVIDISAKEDRFMAECVADGHKRYECESMYSGAHPSQPMPIVVPVVVPR